MPSLDAHAKPPGRIRDVYKEYQKLDIVTLDEYQDLVQFDSGSSTTSPSVQPCDGLPEELQQIFDDFLRDSKDLPSSGPSLLSPDQPEAYQVPNIPGLTIYPSLIPPSVQLSLLSRLLHRDLANPQHQTNIHLHYEVPYPPLGTSYFSPSCSTLEFVPKDPTIHKSFTTQTFLTKKLRWTTLGGQYDWTAKCYPTSSPPPFPPDIKSLIEDIFPMTAEAAIVNLYSPGDTLSLHRDVSEECDRPLVSISLGCEAIFVCALDDEPTAIRLKSGDAVLMSGESRYAWHGVPKVLRGTCPEWMREWPWGEWKGWMEGKRVNLNVRQMFD